MLCFSYPLHFSEWTFYLSFTRTHTHTHALQWHTTGSWAAQYQPAELSPHLETITLPASQHPAPCCCFEARDIQMQGECEEEVSLLLKHELMPTTFVSALWHTHTVYKKRESRYNFSQSGSSAIHPVVMSETNTQSWTMASLSVSVCFSTSSSSSSAADICTKSHCGHQPAHKYSHKCEARSARLLVCDIHGCWNVQPTEWQWKCVCFCACVCVCVCVRTHGQLCVYVLKQSACDERHKEKHTSLTPCL